MCRMRSTPTSAKEGDHLLQLYKSQIPVIELSAIETAALMLETDKSRGYCLEMICADFLAGANLENGNTHVLVQSILRLFKFFPGEGKHFWTSLPRERREFAPNEKSSFAA